MTNTQELQKGKLYLLFNRLAFIEFGDLKAKEKSKELNDSLFKGRQIKVFNLFIFKG